MSARQSDADQWPSFAEELTRKGSAALDKWVTAYEAGKISDRELFILADGLWDTMSGLCDGEFLRILEQIIADIREKGKKVQK